MLTREVLQYGYSMAPSSTWWPAGRPPAVLLQACTQLVEFYSVCEPTVCMGFSETRLSYNKLLFTLFFLCNCCSTDNHRAVMQFKHGVGSFSIELGLSVESSLQGISTSLLL